MKVIGVIPARLASTRFEEKVLAKIAGKPMIQHVWERSKESQQLDDLIIACDDQKILSVAENFGARVFLTAKEHTSGTDRIAEAVKDMDVDVVINIQGDEPLIQASIIDSLANVFKDNASIEMATVIRNINQDDLEDSNIVKVIIDEEGYALCFSRKPILDHQGSTNYQHLGIYAYKKNFLLNYKDLPLSEWEKKEKLEQLRALDAGYRIKTVFTNVETIGVDTPEDLKRVEAFLNK